MDQIPEWLLSQKEMGMCPCGCMGKRKKVNFLEKTMDDMANFVKEVIFSEEVALRKGFLQRIDPRMKVITMLLLILTAAFMHNIFVLSMLYLLSCVLALCSAIPLKLYLKRVWLVIPLFTGIMVLPSLFNYVRPGDSLVTLIDFGHQVHVGPFLFPAELSITKQGLGGAALLIMRVGLSVSLAVLLTLTTRWTNLLKALRVLAVPKIFIMTLEMTYRYIFVLINITSDLFIARKSRTIGKISTQEGRKFVSHTMGSLFGKSYALSEEVYNAMLSRGFTGEPKILSRFRLTLLDFQWLVLVLICILAAFGGEIALG
ncbi:cobalt ECF transporter T component CbiQ [Candidatus Formimonas warabiya]|uniref:Cobalt ECF transporter T component CbiQ n=1 Tax=Formimonas warabiya TaxID=1761012 RepID=A0A3G1L276_FORW1|nr:cobalt ECF transporter T component CbiQ [Candidatus Formimonas warabiya]ATW28893.1 cobalt ECF transporter T component CbiQ [Candidatus Formimonas warabiya]